MTVLLWGQYAMLLAALNGEHQPGWSWLLIPGNQTWQGNPMKYPHESSAKIICRTGIAHCKDYQKSAKLCDMTWPIVASDADRYVTCHTTIFTLPHYQNDLGNFHHIALPMFGIWLDNLNHIPSQWVGCPKWVMESGPSVRTHHPWNKAMAESWFPNFTHLGESPGEVLLLHCQSHDPTERWQMGRVYQSLFSLNHQ